MAGSHSPLTHSRQRVSCLTVNISAYLLILAFFSFGALWPVTAWAQRNKSIRCSTRGG